MKNNGDCCPDIDKQALAMRFVRSVVNKQSGERSRAIDRNRRGDFKKHHRRKERDREIMRSRHYRSRSRGGAPPAEESYSECESEYSRSRSRSRSCESTYRLHIADISENVKRSDIQRLFEEFGGLKEVWMANSPPCFGFAVFKHKSNAMAALKGTDGMMLCGSRIRVTHARPRTRGLGRRFFNPNMRCYECGMSGHFYRDCPELYDRTYSSSKHSRRNSQPGRKRSSYARNDRRYSEEEREDRVRKR